MSSVIIEFSKVSPVAGPARGAACAEPQNEPVVAGPGKTATRELGGLILSFAPMRHGLLAGMALASAPILYLTLEMPKWIVNGALGGDASALPSALQDFTPQASLLALCVLQLAALGALSGLKFVVNLLSANLGERLLRHLRIKAFHQLRLMPPALRNGGVAPVLTQEFEAIAGFAGGAVAIPVGQICAFLTVMVFLIAQDWRLAIAALALTPVQAFVVPMLLQKISLLKRARITAIRSMCNNVSGGGDATFSQALLDARTAQNLRFDIHRRKFAMKAIYNLIGHLTPLSYLSIGGWLVLSGDLTLGALVAAIAAYREGAGPLREMFSFYIRWADARTRYVAVRENLSCAAAPRMAA